ncbi:MAG: MATE family efflux transporter [Victivallaceae bacterium]|nr:MATE family efflux transporter [Victivallaceae bacterium]
MSRTKANFTTGPIFAAMLRTAASVIIGTLAISAYNLTDTFFVARLGTVPMAAMGFTFPVVMIVGCLFHGMSNGIMTTAAQAIGGRRNVRAAKLVTSGMMLASLFSVALSVTGLLTSPFIFRCMGARGEAFELTLEYMNVFFGCCIITSLCECSERMIVGVGDSLTYALLTALGLVLNVILDPAFIFGVGPIPAYGIRGAAIATAISQAVAAAVSLAVLSMKHGLIRLERYDFIELRKLWGTITRFAVPTALGMIMMPIGSFVVTWVAAHFGNVAVAGTAAAGRLELIAFVIPMSFGIPLIPMGSQNFGARLYSRIRECRFIAMCFAATYLFLMAVIYVTFADNLVVLFSEDPEVKRIMVLYLAIVCWGFGMIEVHRYSGFFYIGCGRPEMAAWLNALRIVGLLIPLSLLALEYESLEGLFLARLAADVVSGAIGWVLVIRMTNGLPEDGRVATRAVRREGRVFPHWLRSIAVGQHRIDGK